MVLPAIDGRICRTSGSPAVRPPVWTETPSMIQLYRSQPATVHCPPVDDTVPPTTGSPSMTGRLVLSGATGAVSTGAVSTGAVSTGAVSAGADSVGTVSTGVPSVGPVSP